MQRTVFLSLYHPAFPFVASYHIDVLPLSISREFSTSWSQGTIYQMSTPLSEVRLIVTARVLRRVRVNRSIAVNWPFRCNIAALVVNQLATATHAVHLVIFERTNNTRLKRVERARVLPFRVIW